MAAVVSLHVGNPAAQTKHVTYTDLNRSNAKGCRTVKVQLTDLLFNVHDST